MATEHELRLRDRLAKLRNLRLPGGIGVDATVRKLERDLERLRA